MEVFCYKCLVWVLLYSKVISTLHLVSTNKDYLTMQKMLARFKHPDKFSYWIEKHTASIMVAFVPLQLAIALALRAFTDSVIFPLTYPVAGVFTMLVGLVLFFLIRTGKPNYKRKENLVFSSALLLILLSALEISHNENYTSWLWLTWIYVTAVAAMTPSLLKAGALLLLTLGVSALSIHAGMTPNSPIQQVGSYLFFGIQTTGLCLLMLHFLRQTRSTIRRRYRQKLRKFHELNFFFEKMASPVFVKDDNNNLVYLNQAGAALFNTTRYTLIGKNLREILPKKTADAMLKEDREILAGKEMKASVRKLSLPALNEPQWFKISKQAYVFNHPERRGVVVSLENIHEQVCFKEKLKQSERHFRTIFEKAPVGMMMVKNCFSNFIDVNEALCKVLGYSKIQLLTKTPAEVTHPEDKLKALPLIADAWERGLEFITLEKRFIHRSGQVLYALVALQLVREEGKASHLIGMVLDITSRKQYEEHLKQKSTQLKQSNESLQEFAYAASHDLKQPLRTIGAFVQLMMRYLPKEQVRPEVHEFSDHIKEGINRMEKLINGLLEYSRIGNSQMKFRSTDFADVIITVCKNLGQQIQENQAEIDVVFPVPELYIDPFKFESLLQNLISNAIKYRRKEVRPLITIKVEAQENNWLFAVEDNGKGIPEDQMDHIFGLYKRLEKDKDVDGTGIGLSLCKRIVNRHGGEIWVTSEVGKGSCFYFTISKTPNMDSSSHVEEKLTA